MIKHPDILPEWNGPNYYYRSCQKTSKTKASFYNYCRIIHLMIPTTIEYPDREDPNFYCKVCNITCSNKSLYVNHCSYFHSTNGRKSFIVNPTVLPDPLDPNRYCGTCDKDYTKKHFHSHLINGHKIQIGPTKRQKLKKSKIIKARFFCSPCLKNLASKSSYEKHKMSVHSTSR